MKRELSSTEQREERELLTLQRIVRNLAKQIARACPTLARHRPSHLKRTTLALIKASVRPFPGRPKDQAITEVLQLKSSGLTWREAIRHIHPDFNKWTRLRQIDTINRYQSARRARTRTARRMELKTDGENIRADDISSGPNERETTKSKHEDEDA